MRALDVIVVVAIAGCNPYDRNLGPSPFLCGPTEPRCPKNYSCMTDPATGADVCFASGANTFMCADDSASEPNNTFQTATALTLDASRSVVLDGLAICPAGDVDTYAITLAAGDNLEMLVTFEADGATLTGTILDALGASVVNSTPSASVPDTFRAYAPTVAAGVYYLQITGPNTGENNYALTVNVTGP